MNQSPDMMEGDPSDGGRELNFQELLDICKKRMGVIGGFTLAIGFGMALWSLLQPSIFQSTAALVFDPPGRRTIMTETDLKLPKTGSRELNTQEKLITSYPVLTDTVKRLRLQDYPEFQRHPAWFQRLIEKIQPRWWENVRSWFQQIKMGVKEFLVGPQPETVGSLENLADDQFPDPAEQGLVEMFRGKVRVEQEPETKWINVIVQSESPMLAARAANTLVKVYIEQMQALQTQAAQSASQWFASHLTQLRVNVEKTEQALHRYRSKHGLVKVNQQQGMTEQKLALINSELVSAGNQLTEIEAKIQMIEKVRGKLHAQETESSIHKLDLHELKDVLDSPEIQQIRRKQIELSITSTELSERYGALHPEITRLQIQQRALLIRLREEIELAYKVMKSEYELAREREKVVRKRLAKEKTEKLTDDKFLVKLGILEREANSNRILYDSFLKQMRETNLATEINPSTMYFTVLAIPNGIPITPTPLRNTFLGLLFGMALGVGLAFFLEFWDRSLKGPEDLEEYLAGFQVIGWLPRVPKSHKMDLSRIIESEPMSALADNYRHIRTSVRILSSRESFSEVLITSPGEQEGKTTLAVNLAIGTAQIEGYRVVLIDGDMRRPRLGRIFGLQQQNGNPKGLSDYLANRVGMSEIFHQSDIPNLMVIPAGTPSLNHTELLHSVRLNELLQWCREQHYHVIIDGPPALAFGDSLVLASQVSATIFVVSAGETNRDGAQLAIKQLIEHKARILGIVMQKIPQDRLGYYSHYTMATVEPHKRASDNMQVN